MTGFKPPRETSPEGVPRRRYFLGREAATISTTRGRPPASGRRRPVKILFGINRSSKAMARQQRMRSLALAFALLLSGSPAVFAQKQEKKAADKQEVPDRERNVKKEKANTFKKWIE